MTWDKLSIGKREKPEHPMRLLLRMNKMMHMTSLAEGPAHSGWSAHMVIVKSQRWCPHPLLAAHVIQSKALSAAPGKEECGPRPNQMPVKLF